MFEPIFDHIHVFIDCVYMKFSDRFKTKCQEEVSIILHAYKESSILAIM